MILYSPKAKTRLLSSLAGALLGLSAVCAAPSAASAKDVWFQPLDNLTPTSGGYVDRDFPALFTGNGSWANGVTTFAINSVYAILATDAQLQTMGSFLAARHIALNVTLPMLEISGTPAVEGYTSPGFCWYIAYRLKSLGVAVSSFSADEPLSWGHYYTGDNSVRYSIPQAAQAFASAIAEVHSVFPGAAIVEFEAPSFTSDAQFAADLAEWLADVPADTGAGGISTLIFDVDWNGDWEGAVEASEPALTAAGVKKGVFIVDNNPNEATAKGWTAAASANATAVQASGIPFDTKILANWTGAPTILLPQTGPYPITALLPKLVRSQR